MNTYDDRLTFLLPRPVWVNDMDVSYCSSCNNAFGPLRRRHHCRNCGNIFCHECSARNVPLPQLGYGTKPVRVCNGCFDVAYLVTYAIDEDHGAGTQLFGVRGLLELTEKDDERDLHNMVAYGGVDALIWLCRSSKSIKIHHITTTILAMLAEKESIRPVIITKWALPPLLYLIRYYTNSEIIRKRSPANSIHSSSIGGGTPSLDSGNQSSSDESFTIETRQSIILEIIINCTHTLYQLSRANILSQKEVISEGVLDTLFILASFNISDVQVENEDATTKDDNNEDQEQHHEQITQRITIVQNEAAKAISTISSLVPFQASIIESIQGTKKLSSLLRSSNDEVRKYMAKTIAYLSLRNDKYKPNLLGGDGAKALVSILTTLPQKNSEEKADKKGRLQDLSYYLSREVTEAGNQVNYYNTSTNKKDDNHAQHLNSACVSHACCALANFATNNESQINLMSQPHFLKCICNVPQVFPTHTEIHRHVARLLANLALYEENIKAMLTNKNDTKDGAKDAYSVLPTLLFIGQLSSPGVQRHIVRAIDNLSSNLPVATTDSYWKDLFDGAYLYIRKILEEDDGNEKDVDTIKRAKSIVAREKFESEQQREQHQDNKSSSPQQQIVEEEVVTAVETITISPKESVHENDEQHEEPLTETSVVAAADQPVAVSSTEEEDEGEEEVEEEVKKSSRRQSKNKKKSKKNKKMD